MTAREALHSSASVEWYTPPWIVELVRTLLGGIKFDPASSELANQIVSASCYLTESDDGLSCDWDDRWFCNPPYGAGVTIKWANKMVDQSSYPGVGLLNATPDREWFRPLWEFPICFLYKRVRFYETAEQHLARLRSKGRELVLPQETLLNGRLVLGQQPTYGNVLVYTGDNVDFFKMLTNEVGHVVTP